MNCFYYTFPPTASHSPHSIFQFALTWLIVIWKASLFKSFQWQCPETVNQCVKSLQQNGFIGKYNLLDIFIFPDVMEVSFIHQAKELGNISGFEIGRQFWNTLQE